MYNLLKVSVLHDIFCEILIHLQDIPCIIKSELIEIVLAKMQKPPKHGEINQNIFWVK